MTDEQRSLASTAIADRFLSEIKHPKNSVIAGYAAIRGEVDVFPLLRTLRSMGHRTALPVVTSQNAPLIFKEFDDEETLVEGAYGARVPPADGRDVIPDVLCVPLLGFDADLYRLGYGGGFYDRTIAGLRAQGPLIAVGMAYQWQKIEFCPRDVYDEMLDYVVTDGVTWKGKKH